MKCSVNPIGAVAVLIVLMLAAPAAIAQEAVADGLWQKAVDLAERNTGWIAGVMTITIEELNNRGKVQSSTEMGIKTSLAEDGTLTRELVGGGMPGGFAGMLKSGLSGARSQGDAGQRPQAGAGQRPAFGPGGGPAAGMMGFLGAQVSPFGSSAQQSVTARPTDRTEKVLGKLCAIYEFDVQQAADRTSGTAWLDQQTGVPVKVALAPSKQAETGATVTTEIYYTSTEAGDWHTSAVVTTEEARRLLVLKSTTRRVMKFSGYFRMPEVGEDE